MNVLIIAAHPDDELLGCGGTMARHAAAGDRVEILILAEGSTSRLNGGSNQDLEDLRSAARAAAAALGAQPPRMLGLPDNKMDSLPLLDIVHKIEAVIDEVKPDVVYTHHGGDLNIDHRITHQATVTACRPLPGTTVKRLYAFEVVSSTEWASTATGGIFQPTHFVDVFGHVAAFKAAVDAYAVEMRAAPHPRSWANVEAALRVRGATAGLTAAEAFQVIRQIETD